MKSGGLLMALRFEVFAPGAGDLSPALSAAIHRQISINRSGAVHHDPQSHSLVIVRRLRDPAAIIADP
jgi:hypothetical protein